MTEHLVPAAASRGHRPRLRWLLLVGAISFALVFVLNTVISPQLASSSLPLPNAPAADARVWFAHNELATIVTGILQTISVLFLSIFATAFYRSARGLGVETLRGEVTLAMAATAAMILSSIFGWILAGVADSASLGSVGALRTANFIAGGAIHVALLGLYVVTASRARPLPRSLRLLARIAVVPAVLSLLSVVIFQASALILLGRVLCMAWLISAAITTKRQLDGARP